MKPAHGLPARRGVAVAAVVAVLAAVNLAVIGSIRVGADHQEIAALRVQALRSMYAAESAAMASAELLGEGLPAPAPGSLLRLPGADGVYVAAPTPDAAGEIVAEGRAGPARRRVALLVE